MEANRKVTKIRASIENFRIAEQMDAATLTLKKYDANKHGFTTRILRGPAEEKFRSVRAPIVSREESREAKVKIEP